MVARVTLEIALRKEFDYAIPPELAARIDVGTRVKVPFGPRQVNGVVTEVIEESTHTNLREIVKIIGTASMVMEMASGGVRNMATKKQPTMM